MLTLLVALSAGEKHGYALADDVEHITDGWIRLGPGTLYRTLQRLRVEGLIRDVESGEVEGHEDRRAERRRLYAITDEGRAAARKELLHLRELVASHPASELLDETGRDHDGSEERDGF